MHNGHGNHDDVRWALQHSGDVKKKLRQHSLSRLVERQTIVGEQNWMVENIWERKEIHLIAGPTGAGKSTFMFETMVDVADGKPIFGKFKSFPEPYCYVACDRSFRMTSMNLHRLGFGDRDIPIVSLDEIRRSMGQDVTLSGLLQIVDWARYVYVDGLAYFEPHGNKGNTMSYTQSLLHWAQVRDMLDKTNQTLVGSYHSPKSRPNERYGNPRDRVMGTVGTVGCVATIIDVQFEDENKIRNPTRIISVCPRNYPPFVMKAEVGSNGLLECTPYSMEAETSTASAMIRKDLIMNGAVVGQVIDAIAVRGWKERYKLSTSTITRVVAEFIEKGMWVRIERGRYIIKPAFFWTT